MDPTGAAVLGMAAGGWGRAEGTSAASLNIGGVGAAVGTEMGADLGACRCLGVGGRASKCSVAPLICATWDGGERFKVELSLDDTGGETSNSREQTTS